MRAILDQLHHEGEVASDLLDAWRGQTMRRKPDMLWVLVLLFGLGIVTTGYAQSLWGKGSQSRLEANYSVPLR
ncbi:hypothetical protein [Pseudomonas sp. KNUC1026]|uniref:hypothetical protein n=1 Tax=Pseudomonas sp. KNUC1026 TaxID=2893890 RepID=UPI001F24A69C|nr:hypothetical protein [Pseudomonas sp. KNUC1026]UFH51802.1 hypothetical protein LN139_20520 [Pseudomonas sp. KNUC1026]